MAERWPRTILHADMDAFFAAVEVLDRPDLRGRPILVGHPGRRGVVSTASYEARPFGVGSGIPMARARRLCPEATVIAPRFGRYQEVSASIMRVLESFSPLVEPLSLDEAFIDMTGTERLFGAPEDMGRRLKDSVRAATGLTISVGLSTTKYVAKVASDFEKPDGLTIVPPSEVRSFLDPLPVRALWGVGPKAASRLEALGLRTIGDVARADPARLRVELGELGQHAHSLALADDPRPVVVDREPKSLGHEETLERDIRGPEAAARILRGAADRVAFRLRERRALACAVRVKLKTASFRVMTRQRPLLAPVNSAQPLFSAAVQLLDEFDWEEPLRLVGLSAFALQDQGAPLQHDLFAERDRLRLGRLDETLDELRRRFGPGVIRRGSASDSDSDSESESET